MHDWSTLFGPYRRTDGCLGCTFGHRDDFGGASRLNHAVAGIGRGHERNSG